MGVGGGGGAQAFINQLPVMSSDACAKAIVEAVCRKERHVTEPKWFGLLYLLETLCPELNEWANRAAYEKLKRVARGANPKLVLLSQDKSD